MQILHLIYEKYACVHITYIVLQNISATKVLRDMAKLYRNIQLGFIRFLYVRKKKASQKHTEV